MHLYAQARGRLRYDEALAALVPMSVIEGLGVAGAANGAFTLDEALLEGHRAGGGEGAVLNAPAGQYRIPSRLAKGRRRGAAMDRLPERRDVEGRRARGARGLRLG